MSKVIILHGTGRSGTTMLNNILVNHTDLAWISNIQVHALNYPSISYLNRFVKHSVDLSDENRNRFKIHSSNEPYAMWKRFYTNFNDKNSSPSGAKYLLNGYTDKVVKYSNKKLFVTKITGFSRAKFLEHAFKDYKVVWIDRDPVAVVSSMMKQRWFFKNNLDQFNKMDSFDRIIFYCEYYNQVKASKDEIPKDKLISVQYENLVADPKVFFENLINTLGLAHHNNFYQLIDTWKFQKIDAEFYRNQYSKKEWEFLKNAIQWEA